MDWYIIPNSFSQFSSEILSQPTLLCLCRWKWSFLGFSEWSIKWYRVFRQRTKWFCSSSLSLSLSFCINFKLCDFWIFYSGTLVRRIIYWRCIWPFEWRVSDSCLQWCLSETSFVRGSQNTTILVLPLIIYFWKCSEGLYFEFDRELIGNLQQISYSSLTILEEQRRYIKCWQKVSTVQQS